MEEIAGRYEVLEVIGDGATATVYRVQDRESGEERALKLLRVRPGRSQKRRRRFDREARAMAEVQHPNVLRVHDVGADGDTPFLVMQYAEAGTLGDRLAARGPLSVRWVVGVMLSILDALHAAHALGVIHRDIKPANILLDASGVPLLTDFGIALYDIGEGRETRAGAALGTFSYMAPEQRLDARSATPGADVYGVAATMYELLTGECPVDLFAAPPESPRWWGIPAVLAPVLQRALRHLPEERYGSALAFRDALAEVLPRCTDAAATPDIPADPELDGVHAPEPALLSWYLGTMPERARKLRSLLRKLQRGEASAADRIRELAASLRGVAPGLGLARVAAVAEGVELADRGTLPHATSELLYVVRHLARPRTQGATVLVVASDPDLCGMLTHALTRPGWRVEVVPDLVGADEVAESRHVDVVLLHAGCTGALPAELAMLHALVGTRRVVVLDDETDASMLDVAATLPRPIDPVALMSEVERLVLHGPVVDGQDGLAGLLDRQGFRLSMVRRRHAERTPWAVGCVRSRLAAYEVVAAFQHVPERVLTRWDDERYLVSLPQVTSGPRTRGAMRQALRALRRSDPAVAVAACLFERRSLGEVVRELTTAASGPGLTMVGEEAPAATVLIVDDDDGLVRLVQRVLERDGVRTTHLGSGETVVQNVRETRPDLILLDIGLPGIDGYEVLHALQADPIACSVPTIVLTGRQDDDQVVLALEMGAEDHITKPFDVAVLRARVQRALRRRAARS